MTGSATVSERVTRHGWLLAAVWLLFLVFPIGTILTADGIGTAAKVVSMLAIACFCAIYLHGFHRHHEAEQRSWAELEDPVSRGTDGRWHAIALSLVTVALYALVGLPALGVVPFIVSFATFHFPWPTVWAIFGLGLAVTFLVPVAEGELANVWFLSIIVAAVGGSAMLIRVVEDHQAEQARMRTRLAVSDDRNRMARDVHDVLGHSLTAVILKAELCQRLLDGVEPVDEPARQRVQACRDELAELHSVSRSALAQIRSTVGGLRAANLADEVTVARTVLADAGVGLLVTGEPDDVPESHRSVLAWVVREAVTNVVRHARASHCHIDLAPGPDRVLLRISDDGVGMRANGDGNGLRGLRERVERSGGELRIDGRHGTRIEVAR